MTILATCCIVLIAATPQEPVAVEVVGPARVPGDALREQLEKGADEFLLFDVNYGVREATGDLHELWARLESARAEGMRALLDRMPSECAEPYAACANVAGVARALLAHPKEQPRQLEPSQRDELREVETAAKGSLRFLPAPLDQDWSIARPIGAYANERYGPDGIAGLYRATIYLRRYLEAWPEETRAAWGRLAASCRGSSPSAQIDLARVESQMPVLFGANVDSSGVLRPRDPPDRAWLRAHAADESRVDQKLAALFAAMPMSSPGSLSDGVLRLCHELTIAQPADPLFGAMDARQWRAKWRDAASFAYLGLREVDCLAVPYGRASEPPAPRVIVEPLPAVWEALRWLDRRIRDPRPGDGWLLEPSWVDPVLDALALQQKGQDLPADLNDHLRLTLLRRFQGRDKLLGTTTQIEGCPGQVRRAVPQLVRLPIQWRGQTKKALALRLFIEQQGPDAGWREPGALR